VRQQSPEPGKAAGGSPTGKAATQGPKAATPAAKEPAPAGKEPAPAGKESPTKEISPAGKETASTAKATAIEASAPKETPTGKVSGTGKELSGAKETAPEPRDTTPPAEEPPSGEKVQAPGLDLQPPPASPPLAVPDGGSKESQAPAPGASIVGEITGRADLVEEVVILGPDSLLKQFARVKPAREGGTARFLASSVPPGGYFVVPMGKRGASLASRPGMSKVQVTAGSGARADFAITGPL
jgi:hypothetical protein